MRPLSVAGRLGSSSAQLALILSVLAFVGAVFKWVVPGFSAAQRPQKIQQSAVVLLGRLSGLRALAMTQGVDYEFLQEPGGRRYLILPAAATESQVENPTSDAEDEELRNAPPRLTGLLPEGSRFISTTDAAKTAKPVSSDRLHGLADRVELAGVAWGPPVRFTAEGMATDATVTISDGTQNERTLLIRGSNGTVRMAGR